MSTRPGTGILPVSRQTLSQQAVNQKKSGGETENEAIGQPQTCRGQTGGQPAMPVWGEGKKNACCKKNFLTEW
ncbi:hypothetical protein HUU39_12390 [candidate division KSB1 bacterium]|nr:hypothetical protein [bacterium]NUM66059.1 hypothetical protein [candidate division KSB1 bacterium]